MLNEIIESVKRALEALEIDETPVFSQVEYYEGQLEDIENSFITPPSAFIQLDYSNNDTENYLELTSNIDIYLCAFYMKGSSPAGMYNLLWLVISSLHNEYLLKEDESVIEKVFFKSFDRLGIFPGFAAYKMTFSIGTIS